MNCMSNELLTILPPRLRCAVSADLLPQLQEIRLRAGGQVRLLTDRGMQTLDLTAAQEDLSFVINSASRYSPWNAVTAAKGFLTAPGGHRIGICGDAVMDRGSVQGLRTPASVCIRVAKDLPGIGRSVDLREPVLIVGPPGSGKTTLLRDLIRRIGAEKRGAVSVVDERGELFPRAGGRPCFDSAGADILSGCPKPEGIEMVLRSMSPQWIAVDEVTAPADCDALVQAGWCGVKLLATVHAANVEDLLHRPVYRPLAQAKLFRTAVVLNRDKRMERVVL